MTVRKSLASRLSWLRPPRGGFGRIATVHAAGSDVLKIGLVGCGGRGTGSLRDSLLPCRTSASSLGDLFRERPSRRVPRSPRPTSARADRRPGRTDLHRIRQLQGVIAESDIVHIALPSRFYPPYNLAAVQAGKHAFTEKPNGIDADGVHVTIQAAKIAEEKRLANVSGLCYRYDLLRLQAIERSATARSARFWPPSPTTCEHHTTSFRKAGMVGNGVSDSQLGTFHVAQRRRNPAVAAAQSRLRPLGAGG